MSRNIRYVSQPQTLNQNNNNESELQLYINNAIRNNNSKRHVVIADNSIVQSRLPQISTRRSLNYLAEDKDISNLDVSTDTNFEIVHKKNTGIHQAIQNVTLKYLKPPPLQQHGDLTIRQESDVQLPAGKPHVVREQPEQPIQPRSVIIREEPPQRPPVLPAEQIVIPGRTIPAPPRQKIVEKLAATPAGPPNILIERWLGYPEQTRNVRFIPGKKLAPLAPRRNILIKWESPQVQVRQKLDVVGVTVVDPEQYRARHGASLVSQGQLPPIVSRFANQIPAGEVLGANQIHRKPRLVGDVNALALLNSSRLSNRISSSSLSSPIAESRAEYDNDYSLSAESSLEDQTTQNENIYDYQSASSNYALEDTQENSIAQLSLNEDAGSSLDY